MRVRRLVIGTDFGAESLGAAEWAVRHFAEGAEVVLLHSVAIPTPPALLRGRFPEQERLIETAVTGAKARLAEFARTLHEHGAPLVRTEVRVGRSAERLDELAREIAADAIVVGAHERRPGPWEMLRSTAEILLRTAAAPVLLVGKRADRRPRRLLVALDDGEVEPWVLLWTRIMSERFDAPVDALHVAPSLAATSTLALAAGAIGAANDVLRLDVDALERERDHWRRRLRETGVVADRTTVDVVYGDPADEIVDAAMRHESDILVIGNQRPGPSLLGSVLRRVLRRSPCPVLVVPEPTDRLVGS
jgi:nucleotide-binding universal stress UspA family protein